MDPIQLDVALHPKQAEVFMAMQDTALRELTVRKGRRFGGSYLSSLGTTKFAIEHPMSPNMPSKPTQIAYFGPLYSNAKRIYDEVILSFGKALANYRESDLTLTWHGGARGRCYSGEKISAALGDGFDIAVVDEASNFQAQTIRSHIIPALTDRKGRLWQISSPRHGKLNHFAQRCMKAEAREIPGLIGFHATSYDNLSLDRNWIEAVRTDPDMDDLTFREEWLAEILDSSSSWLDPGGVETIASEKIPGNTYNVLLSDFAWGKPEVGMIDQATRRRKDNNVLAVVSQDALGNVYVRKEGVYEKFMEPDEAFDNAARLIRTYDVKKFCVEREVNVSHSTDDMFGRLWRNHCDKYRVPTVGMVRPHRKGGWKTPAIRRWSTLLTRKRFFVEEGSILQAPLLDEMMNYSETAAANDRCHDDVLVALSDIMIAGIWQGRGESEAALHAPASGPDLYHLADAWSWASGENSNEYSPRRSRYCGI